MKIENRNGKDYVYCTWRRRFVRLTPEEYVRQTFLRRLVDEYKYPNSMIITEFSFCLGQVKKRADAVVLSLDLRPQVLIEFKRETVALTQKVLDQAAVYNRHFHVPYLMLSNGRETLVARVLENGFEYLSNIPEWNQL